MERTELRKRGRRGMDDEDLSEERIKDKNGASYDIMCEK